jgi:hypothetical protein
MKKLDCNTFDELLQEQEPFLRKAPSLDLREIGFVSPAGLAQLAALFLSVCRKETSPPNLA